MICQKALIRSFIDEGGDDEWWLPLDESPFLSFFLLFFFFFFFFFLLLFLECLDVLPVSSSELELELESPSPLPGVPLWLPDGFLLRRALVGGSPGGSGELLLAWLRFSNSIRSWGGDELASRVKLDACSVLAVLFAVEGGGFLGDPGLGLVPCGDEEGEGGGLGFLVVTSSISPSSESSDDSSSDLGRSCLGRPWVRGGSCCCTTWGPCGTWGCCRSSGTGGKAESCCCFRARARVDAVEAWELGAALLALGVLAVRVEEDMRDQGS